MQLLVKPEAKLLAKACSRAAHALGLARNELSGIVGKHPADIERTGLDPETKEGELALLLIRVYCGLYSLLGGDQALMRHWMKWPNDRFGKQSPRQLLKRVEGLTRVVGFLDAIRS